MSLWRLFVIWLARNELAELRLKIAMQALQISMYKGAFAVNRLNEAAAEIQSALVEYENTPQEDKKKVIH